MRKMRAMKKKERDSLIGEFILWNVRQNRRHKEDTKREKSDSVKKKKTEAKGKRVFLLSDCILYTLLYVFLSLSLAVLLCIYYKTIFNKTSRSDQYCVARRNLTRTVSSSSSSLSSRFLSTSSLVSSETNELIDRGVCFASKMT